MLLVIGGLSGAGKTTLGRHFEEKHAFKWLELDPSSGGDAVDKHGIRIEWDGLNLCGDPAPLLRRFSDNTVLTVTSLVVIPLVSDFDSFRVRYLYGPPEKCSARAIERSPYVVTQDSWNKNNECLLKYLNDECPLARKINVFDDMGQPRDVDDLAVAALG